MSEHKDVMIPIPTLQVGYQAPGRSPFNNFQGKGRILNHINTIDKKREEIVEQRQGDQKRNVAEYRRQVCSPASKAHIKRYKSGIIHRLSSLDTKD
jgi:hypothetical protein